MNAPEADTSGGSMSHGNWHPHPHLYYLAGPIPSPGLFRNPSKFVFVTPAQFSQPLSSVLPSIILQHADRMEPQMSPWYCRCSEDSPSAEVPTFLDFTFSRFLSTSCFFTVWSWFESVHICLAYSLAICSFNFNLYQTHISLFHIFFKQHHLMSHLFIVRSGRNEERLLISEGGMNGFGHE